MKSTCKKCGSNIHKQFTGKRFSSGAKRYIDDEGTEWRGNFCPQCVRVNQREYQINYRKRKLEREKIRRDHYNTTN